MLDAHLMIRADNGSLQKAPNALDTVSMNVADNPFLLRVINPLMLRVGILNSPIRGHFVCVDRFRIWRGVIVDKLVKHGLSGVRNNLKANLAFALDGSDSDSFVPFVAASHSTHLPADVGFVYFDHSAQKLAVNLAHGSADSVTEIPSRLVRHVKRALDLQRRHALFGFSHQVDRKE